VLAFPTDQGWFEADDSNTLRLKYKSVYGFGQYPTAVVFDKTDLLGGNALPLYTWMTKTLSNPWGVDRLVFNYEKFLVDDRGQPRRRYPRKFPIQLMDADVRTARCWRQRPPAAVRRGTRPMHPSFHLHPPSPTCLVTERDWPMAFPVNG
jgi:glutathione peroxidase